MKVESLSYKELLKKRPLNVQAIYGDEPVGLVSGRDIIAVSYTHLKILREGINRLVRALS